MANDRRQHLQAMLGALASAAMALLAAGVTVATSVFAGRPSDTVIVAAFMFLLIAFVVFVLVVFGVTRGRAAGTAGTAEVSFEWGDDHGPAGAGDSGQPSST